MRILHPFRERVILQPKGRQEAILELVANARRRIALSVFRCTDERLIAELNCAVRRGVEVRVLMTRQARGWKHRLDDLYVQLQAAGVDTRFYEGPTRKYHAKYLVADDSHVIVTSLNFTRKCYRKTCDFLFETRSPFVAGELVELFECDWHGKSRFTPGSGSSLIVAPHDARPQIRELILSASRSIRIIDHRLKDPEIRALLQVQSARGVAVTVLGAGQVPDLKSHGRLLLIDSRVAVLGSLSFSTGSLNSRRELAVTVRNQAVLVQLQNFFQSCCAAFQEVAA